MANNGVATEFEEGGFAYGATPTSLNYKKVGYKKFTDNKIVVKRYGE